MDGIVSAFVDAGLLGQLSGEWLHVALVALQYGVVGLATILWRHYRAVIQRAEALEAKHGIEAEARNDSRDDAIRRYGEELSDVKRALCVLAAQVQGKLPKTVTVDIPEWPSR